MSLNSSPMTLESSIINDSSLVLHFSFGHFMVRSPNFWELREKDKIKSFFPVEIASCAVRSTCAVILTIVIAFHQAHNAGARQVAVCSISDFDCVVFVECYGFGGHLRYSCLGLF